MFRDKKLTIAIVAVLMISVIGLGIAFAAFSQTLTINGTGTVESSSWSVVFEGVDGSNTIGAPTLVGTAAEVTHPTIKNNSTEISNYEVTLKTPGDSVIYNFKIHNKGDYAANLTTLTVAGVNRPTDEKLGNSLVTDMSSLDNNTRSAVYQVRYSFKYTDDNSMVGQNPGRDCLEPGESVNVSLKIVFNSDNPSETYYLPKTDVVLDNLGISAVYNQSNNGSCAAEPINNYSGNFINYDYAYYTYESKSFIGTGIDNVILSENTIGSTKKYASAKATQCSDGSAPVVIDEYNNKGCQNGATPVFSSKPAESTANAYCTGCRLMTHAEANLWCGPDFGDNNEKCVPANIKGVGADWWLADAYGVDRAWMVSWQGWVGTINYNALKHVRPAVDIPSTATMSGSGTQLDPYVITVN